MLLSPFITSDCSSVFRHPTWSKHQIAMQKHTIYPGLLNTAHQILPLWQFIVHGISDCTAVMLFHGWLLHWLAFDMRCIPLAAGIRLSLGHGFTVEVAVATFNATTTVWRCHCYYWQCHYCYWQFHRCCWQLHCYS